MNPTPDNMAKWKQICGLLGLDPSSDNVYDALLLIANLMANDGK